MAESIKETGLSDPSIELRDEFDMLRLPLGLQDLIIRKFDYGTYSRAAKCSKTLNNTCNRTHHRFPLEVLHLIVFDDRLVVRLKSNITIPFNDVTSLKARLVAKSMRIDESCKSSFDEIIEMFRQNGTTVDNLTVPLCGPHHLDRLVQILGVKSLDANHLPNEHLRLEAVRNLDHLLRHDNRSITDELLLGLRCPRLSLAVEGITSKGISRFIDQWRNGERAIKQLMMYFVDTFGAKKKQDIAIGLGGATQISSNGAGGVYCVHRLNFNPENCEVLIVTIDNRGVTADYREVKHHQCLKKLNTPN